MYSAFLYEIPTDLSSFKSILRTSLLLKFVIFNLNLSLILIAALKLNSFSKINTLPGQRLNHYL